ncbi:aquaporin-like protein [Lipomyces arxii]|uniref:aquaporin-like protein n=1 Tax=Lipomyces arxii TaxID=56418 RepID=UPI0034CFAB1E
MGSIQDINTSGTPSPFESKRMFDHINSPQDEYLRRNDLRGEDELEREELERVEGVKVTRYHKFRRIVREPLAEMMGSMILIVAGDGAVAQSILSNHSNGNSTTINLCFGFGLTVGYLCAVAGGAAGHLNPAITVTNCIFRGFPWKKLPIYAFAQMMGCGIGAAIVYGTYRNALTNFDGGIRQVVGEFTTAGIFCTYPTAFLDLPGKVMQEFTCSAILAVFVNAIACQASPKLPYKLATEWHLIRALLLGLALFTIGSSIGWQTGYAMNPARDFAPRLVSFMAGYGHEVFSAYGHYFWIPLIIPFPGAIFGQAIFDFMVYDGESENIVTDPVGTVESIKGTVNSDLRRRNAATRGEKTV